MRYRRHLWKFRVGRWFQIYRAKSKNTLTLNQDTVEVLVKMNTK